MPDPGCVRREILHHWAALREGFGAGIGAFMEQEFGLEIPHLLWGNHGLEGKDGAKTFPWYLSR